MNCTKNCETLTRSKPTSLNGLDACILQSWKKVFVVNEQTFHGFNIIQFSFPLQLPYEYFSITLKNTI